MSKFKRINPQGLPLTVEKYRELSGKHDLTDDEAAKIVDSINQFARILFNIAAKETYCNDNQIVVSLKDNSESLNDAA